jgi:outer membrane protein insertion porin family
MRVRDLRLAIVLLCLTLLGAQKSAGTAHKTSPSSAAELSNSDTFVDSLTLTGISKLSAAEQKQIADDVEDHQYPRDNLKEIAERVHYALQTRGYFRAHVGDPEVKILSQTPRREIVAVTLAVSEGEQYRLKEITFANSKAVPDTDLRRQFPLQNGDIFDTAKIRAGLEAIRRLYASKGYPNFTPVPVVDVNEAARLITLNINVDEGATTAQ